MKKRVGTLNNIPIVEGDPNLLTNKELLHKGGGQLSKRTIDGKVEDLGGGNSSSSCEEEYYFLIDDEAKSNPYIEYLTRNVTGTNHLMISAKLIYPSRGIIYADAITGMSGAESMLGYSIPRISIIPDVFKPMDFLDWIALCYATEEANIKTKEEILQAVDNFKKEISQFQVTKEEYYENNFTNVEELLTAVGM